MVGDGSEGRGATAGGGIGEGTEPTAAKGAEGAGATAAVGTTAGIAADAGALGVADVASEGLALGEPVIAAVAWAPEGAGVASEALSRLA